MDDIIWVAKYLYLGAPYICNTDAVQHCGDEVNIDCQCIPNVNLKTGRYASIITYTVR